MATQKCWIIKYVVGNPAMFSRVTTDASGAIKRGEALAGAEKVAANGWRVWIEHAVTGKRIFESDAEKGPQTSGGGRVTWIGKYDGHRQFDLAVADLRNSRLPNCEMVLANH
ncbi:hypothetical protein [Massilia sp. NR 4-1]|uniref:hypothetical protein n=1 Tax=Massilia sp. NR 4-1 TaxID=1678028 RepID=UPI0012370D26|nr:hypothetical protein [Massilia sp. NR 4-1]